MHWKWMIGLAAVLALTAVGCGSYSDGYYDSYGYYGAGYHDDHYRRYGYGPSAYRPGHYGYYQQPYAYGRPRVYRHDDRIYRGGGPWDRPPVVATPGHVPRRRYVEPWY